MSFFIVIVHCTNASTTKLLTRRIPHANKMNSVNEHAAQRKTRKSNVADCFFPGALPGGRISLFLIVV